MKGQLTIWDMPGMDNDLTECMKHGMFEGSSVRIFALYKHEHDKRKRAAFLAKEYGIGGRSCTLKSGKSGFVDFNSKGVFISSFKDGDEQRYSWADAEREVDKMIREGRYMSEKDMNKWNSLPRTPYPDPAYRYPPDNDGDES